MLKRKATQLINNLVLCREVAVQYCEQIPYRVGYLTLLFEDKDEDTVKAVVGTVAMLTAVSKEACEEILYPDCSLEFLHNLFTNPNVDLQRKGIEIALNMMKNTKDVAKKLMETDIIEPLRALSKDDLDDTVLNKEIEELASLALETAEWDKILGNVEGNGTKHW